MEAYLSVLTFALISVVSVCGIYVLTGLTGMFSLGQAAFMAIGAYISGMLVVRLNMPFALAAIIAVAGKYVDWFYCWSAYCPLTP